jgi:branched-chain amino acid transport system permease protein
LATIVERSAAPSFLAAGLKESALAAFAAFLLAFPLLGFHLVDIPGGVTVRTRWHWVAIGVVAVFVGRFLLVLVRQAHPERFAKAFSFSLPRPSRIPLNDLIGALLAAFAVALPFLPFTDRYIIDISISVLIYVMLGWGLNIVVGLAGLLDLGYVAFYAVGAYSFALLSQHFGLGFWECLPLAGAFAAMFGVLLGFPVLRLRGDYLAIVTLGFGEMIRIILLNWQHFTGGPNGLSSIPRPSFFGFPFARNAPEGTTTFHQLFGIDFDVMHRTYFLYYVILVLALLTNFFSMRIRKLPVGRAWEALREDEIACRSLGINPTNTKLSAFAIGAMFGGFAGSFFATRQGFISPESFTFPESATILAIVVLGGLGSQLGVVIAAAFLVLAPEFLRDFAQFRMLAFGAAMVAVMVWRPQGLVSHRDPTITLRPATGSAS